MSHSHGPRTTEPLLDSSDEEGLGQSRREVGLGLGDDTEQSDGGVGYASTSERRHQLRSRSPGEVARLVFIQEMEERVGVGN